MDGEKEDTEKGIHILRMDRMVLSFIDFCAPISPHHIQLSLFFEGGIGLFVSIGTEIVGYSSVSIN